MSKKIPYKKFETFEEFYPFYLGEHSHMTNRKLHFIGTSFVILFLLLAIVKSSPSLIYYCPLIGYGFAWVGHFFFEKNKPATFKHPIFSLMGDFRMWYDILQGKQKCF